MERAGPIRRVERHRNKAGGGVWSATRGGKDGGSPISETKRDYQVGRGKPPVDSRFKKGQSGDPRGLRPKNLPALSVDALNEKVVATIYGQPARSPARGGREPSSATFGPAFAAQPVRLRS